ncbi:MAG: hypothetical protein FWD93_05515, partial [Coriobacteriia bacterium]|nr:hypothetical protein [Coriobacteriia bacterium]
TVASVSIGVKGHKLASLPINRPSLYNGNRAEHYLIEECVHTCSPFSIGKDVAAIPHKLIFPHFSRP